jgi:hypothetical protein
MMAESADQIGLELALAINAGDVSGVARLLDAHAGLAETPKINAAMIMVWGV